MKKTDKKEFSKDELKRHVGAILEEVKDGFKVQREYFMGVNQRLGGVEKILDIHSNQITNITMDMIEIKRDVKEMKFDVKCGLDNKVDKKHFVDLEGRVRVLEKA